MPNSTANANTIETVRSSYELLDDPLLNKGTAFTEAERDAFDLYGLLPPVVATLDEQIGRRLQAFRALPEGLRRYVFLRGLQDSNETLFYALLARHLPEMLPVIYTPTVGLGCQQFSDIYRKPRGLFLSIPHQNRLDRIFANLRFDQVGVIVVTDGERILGLGDQGAGGMGISIGKLALYTACAGIHPATTLPILLDVGTDNPDRLTDPLYIGWRHERVRGQAYDDFIEAFIHAVAKRWPRVLLQWEDFAQSNAGRLLERYRDRLCTFNDDIQGTAAVATGTLMAAINITGIPLKDQRIAVLGAGSAGSGIGSLLLRAMVEAGLSDDEARSRFYAVDRNGLLVEGMTGILPFQEPFVQRRAAIADWTLHQPDKIDLLDVVVNARPTVLIGVSGQPGVFSEAVVRAMARNVERPVIFPLSNPTSRSEASPTDLLAWTDGRAIIGTGSPFPPVERNGKYIQIDQTNNSYIFPGIGLGVIASRASYISDAMFMASARALAETSPARLNPEANLLPSVDSMREVSFLVALAVARQAQFEGVAEPCEEGILETRIRAMMWEPKYLSYRRKSSQTELNVLS